MNNIIEFKKYQHPRIGHVYNMFDDSVVYVKAIKDYKVFTNDVMQMGFFGRKSSVYHIDLFTNETYLGTLNELIKSKNSS